MKKNVLILLTVLNLFACAELQQVVNQLPQGGGISNTEIASGLRQALNFGIDKQVSKLTQKDGFFKNELVKIVLPEELQKVDDVLRGIGLSNLADEGLKVLNRAAEDAVVEAKPIFVKAIRDFTFNDAKRILFSQNDLEATQYLKNKTVASLQNAFAPKIDASLSRVGADRIWAEIIEKYNTIPLVKPVNPDLTAYVTGKAIDGLFVKIGNKEKEIRNSVASRTTTLLQRVFALQ